MIKHILNTDSDKHIICMLLSVTFLSLIIILGIQIDRIGNLEDNLDTYKNLFLQENHEQNLIIIDLQDLQEEQTILNTSFNGRIHSNFNGIQDNSDSILNNKIDIDQISREGLNTVIEEIIKDIERLERLIK